jgi:hypothetical protein
MAIDVETSYEPAASCCVTNRSEWRFVMQLMAVALAMIC